MPAYVIVDIEVKDPETYEGYKKQAPASIAHYGGKYIARGGECCVLEGEWIPNRFVILQFDSVERAKEWLNSPEYAPARRLRRLSAHTNMIVTEGLSES